MFVLVLIGVPILEVLVFVEVGRTIGWLAAVVLQLGSSLLGVWLVRIQGRTAFARVSLAVAERRASGRAVLDGALGFLGSVLLVLPGFLTDALGAVLLFAPTRALTRRWISLRYAERVMSFATSAARFSPRARGARSADVESTAVEEDPEQLGR